MITDFDRPVPSNPARPLSTVSQGSPPVLPRPTAIDFEANHERAVAALAASAAQPVSAIAASAAPSSFATAAWTSTPVGQAGSPAPTQPVGPQFAASWTTPTRPAAAPAAAAANHSASSVLAQASKPATQIVQNSAAAVPADSNFSLPPIEEAGQAVPPKAGMETRPEALFDQPIAPNPFPPRDEPKGSALLPLDGPEMGLKPTSPSDAEPVFPDRAKEGTPGSDSSDPTQPWTRSVRKPSVNCDDVRMRVAAADIGSIDLDIAPSFGTGYNDKASNEERQKTFIQSSPLREWHDRSGSKIAEGRLVDFSHHRVVVESKTGSRQSLDIRSLSDADAVYAFDAWGLPVTCSLAAKPTGPRLYEPTTVAWKASGLCHKPLYFEEIQLERSGHEYGPILQPALSTVHFFKNIAFLPYKMGIHPPHECQYALGHYRPGNCAPWSIEPVPLSLRGLAVQGAAITGGVLMLP
jgi:hypothetical protein